MQKLGLVAVLERTLCGPFPYNSSLLKKEGISEEARGDQIDV